MSNLGRCTLAALLVALACSGRNGVERPVRSHMYDHFQRASHIQMSIIEGRLERARGPATWMAEHERPEGLPAAADPYVADMRGMARRIADAETLAEAAAATAAMGRTCGACHDAVEGGPRIEMTSGPPVTEGLAGRMILHVWGADRLWEGLIGPSDDAWGAGLAAFHDATLVPADITEAGEPTDEVRALSREVRTLSVQAGRTLDWQARAEIYGRLLGTCSRCHELVGVNR